MNVEPNGRRQPAPEAAQLRAAAWLLAAACTLAAIFVLRETLGMIAAGVFRAPVMDQWGFLNRVRLWQAGRQSFWNLLWRQHNEHRMILGFLILSLDRAMTAARGTFSTACAWALQILHALLWCAIFWRAEESGPSRTAYAALVLGAFFSAAQFENFLWPFQANFVAVFLLASAAVLCFIRHCRTRGAGVLVAALVFAVAASFCMANGVLLWPIFLLMAVLEGAPSRTGVTVLAFGAALMAAYLHGYATPAQHANPLLSILHPQLLTGYLGIYFFNVWAGLPKFVTPVRAGLFAGALFAAFFGTYAWRRRQGGARDYAFYAYSALFLFGTAALTALGRVNLGWSQAESSRYGTPIFIFWVCLASGAGLFLSRRAKSAAKIMAMPSIAAAILAGMVLPRQASSARAGIDWTRQVDISGLSLAVGAADPAAWSRLYPHLEMIRSVLPYLKSRRLSLFSDPAVEELGRPLSSFLQTRPPLRCPGSFSGFIPVPSDAPGLRVGRVFGKGWSLSARRRPLQTVFIAGARGVIVGLAYAFRPAERFSDFPDPLRGDWGGYARLAPGTRRLSAYGVLPDDRACLIGSLALSSARFKAAKTFSTGTGAAPGAKSRL